MYDFMAVTIYLKATLIWGLALNPEALNYHEDTVQAVQQPSGQRVTFAS